MNSDKERNEKVDAVKSGRCMPPDPASARWIIINAITEHPKESFASQREAADEARRQSSLLSRFSTSTG
jgi:hypothetical protein